MNMDELHQSLDRGRVGIHFRLFCRHSGPPGRRFRPSEPDELYRRPSFAALPENRRGSLGGDPL
ncbi:hypothetical protein KSP39_PZI020890 [Platanthera zijinensis]|uniref:Uncharacterized protein n=1 Tax=Platanthera zijinensis TaxID=2320716 RepID=A0AAP0FWH2_9ASPA